ncbi:MAG: type IV pilus biogenesis/stability protein PilW [Pseudomonadales bacterium]
MRLIACVNVLIMAGLLAGCVTETNSRSGDRNEKEMLQSQVSLGVGYMRNGNYDRARENLEAALEIDSRSPEAHNYLGLLNQLEGDLETADDHFTKAIRYNRNYAAARNNYGAFLYAQKRYEEAIEQLEVAARDRTYRNQSQVYENLGISYLKLGDDRAAEEAFRQAIAITRAQPRALLELAVMEYEDGNYEQARSLYSQFKEVSRQSARSLWLGIRLARIFDNEDEEASLSMALKNIYPDSPQYKAYKRTTSE